MTRPVKMDRRGRGGGLNPVCPEFVPQQQRLVGQQLYGNAQTLQSPGWNSWMPRGHATWQYDLFANRVVGSYYPEIRTKGAYLYDLDAVPFNPNIDVPISVCFNCRQLGHSQQQCGQPKIHTFCNNCGRFNVTVDKCPRCARAYNRYLLEKQARKEMGMRSVDGDSEEERLVEIFELIENSEENSKFGKKSTSNSVANQTEEGYLSFDESENFDDFIVDEDAPSCECVSDFLRDFIVLMDTVKNLTIETQNEVVQQFVAERRKQLKEEDEE